MSRQEDLIVNCAKRITTKLFDSKYYKLNGEYPKPVQIEIKRMIKHVENIGTSRGNK